MNASSLRFDGFTSILAVSTIEFEILFANISAYFGLCKGFVALFAFNIRF